RGVILANGDGRILRANRTAERIGAQRDGFHIDAAGIYAALPAETALLHKMIYEAAETSAGRSHASGGSLLLSRPSGKRPWIVVVSPHRTESMSAVAAILITDPQRQAQPNAEIVSQLLGFTRAETRLALILAQGVRIENAAETLGIKLTTARTHMQRMLDK